MLDKNRQLLCWALHPPAPVVKETRQYLHDDHPNEVEFHRHNLTEFGNLDSEVDTLLCALSISGRNAEEAASFGVPSLPPMQEKLCKLASFLLPVEVKHLLGPRIAFSLDGAFSRIPPCCLLPDLEIETWLIPSLQTIPQQEMEVSTEEPRALVVGNPFPMPGTLRDLPGAIIESHAISVMLQKKNVWVLHLTGEQAAKDTIIEEMKGARFIHLATHGIIDQEEEPKDHEPSPSFMQGKLAVSNEYITANNIAKLKGSIIADIVVISACDTAKGKVTSERVQGLARAFLLAGAKAVVVNLHHQNLLSGVARLSSR